MEGCYCISDCFGLNSASYHNCMKNTKVHAKKVSQAVRKRAREIDKSRDLLTPCVISKWCEGQILPFNFLWEKCSSILHNFTQLYTCQMIELAYQVVHYVVDPSNCYHNYTCGWKDNNNKCQAKKNTLSRNCY